MERLFYVFCFFRSFVSDIMNVLYYIMNANMTSELDFIL